MVNFCVRFKSCIFVNCSSKSAETLSFSWVCRSSIPTFRRSNRSNCFSQSCFRWRCNLTNFYNERAKLFASTCWRVAAPQQRPDMTAFTTLRSSATPDRPQRPWHGDMADTADTIYHTFLSVHSVRVKDRSAQGFRGTMVVGTVGG